MLKIGYRGNLFVAVDLLLYLKQFFENKEEAVDLILASFICVLVVKISLLLLATIVLIGLSNSVRQSIYATRQNYSSPKKSKRRRSKRSGLKVSVGQCPVCSCDTVEDVKVCKLCDTPHHADCWDYNGKCAIYGCGSVALRIIPTSVELAMARTQVLSDWPRPR